jgi:uncharacterized protein (TIGR02284 family)
MLDHQRHVSDLTPLVQELGGQPSTKANFKRVLVKGKVVLGGLGGDRSVLEAMKSNEEMTSKAYQAAAAVPGVPGHMRQVLERNYSDELRHLRWIEERLTQVQPRPPAL